MKTATAHFVTVFGIYGSESSSSSTPSGIAGGSLKTVLGMADNIAFPVDNQAITYLPYRPLGKRFRTIGRILWCGF